MISLLKSSIKAIGLKKTFQKLQDIALRFRGYDVLSYHGTIAYMQPYIISEAPDAIVVQPEIRDCYEVDKIIYPAVERIADKVCVWDYVDEKNPAQLTRYGSVVIKEKVLFTDFGVEGFYQDIWRRHKRPTLILSCVVAPFSHPQAQGEVGVKGYFDFLFFVAAKLARLKDALPKEDITKMPFTYIPFNTAFEKEILELMGFKMDNFIDISTKKIIASRVITGNKGYWHPHEADVSSLKHHIYNSFKPVKTEANRIYISRNCRRRVTNEAELILVLKKYNFIIFEDKPRTVKEQMSIYHNASFIMGPHGASFANIIWCEPGTHLFELLSANYNPDCFTYLAALMKMKHTAHYEGYPDSNVHFNEGLYADITISIPKIEKALQEIFKEG